MNEAKVRATERGWLTMGGERGGEEELERESRNREAARQG